MINVVINNDYHVYIYLKNRWELVENKLSEQSKGNLRKIEESSTNKEGVRTVTKNPGDGGHRIPSSPVVGGTTKDQGCKSVLDLKDKIKVILDIGKEQSTDQFEFFKNEEHDARIFTAKDNYVFVGVIKSSNPRSCESVDREIWDAKDATEYSNKVILKGSKRSEKYLAIILVQGHFILYYKEYNKAWVDITHTGYSIDKFKMFKANESGSGYLEILPHEYKREIVGFSYGYRFEDGVKCIKLMYGIHKIWKHDNKSDEYPRALYYNMRTEELVISFSSGTSKGLDINKRKGSSELDLSSIPDKEFFESTTDDSRKSVTYTPKYGTSIDSVLRDGVILWEAEKDSEYADKVVLEGIGEDQNDITVQRDNEVIKKLRRSSIDEPWNEVTPDTGPSPISPGVTSRTQSPPTGSTPSHKLNSFSDVSKKIQIELHLDSEKSTHQYEYTRNSKTRTTTYTAKEKFCFNEVKLLGGVFHIMRADRNVWKSPDINTCSSKVLLKELGNWKYDLTIYLLDGTELSYHRPAWGSMWKRRAPTSESEDKSNVTKSKFS